MLRSNFRGSPFLGVFGTATKNSLFVTRDVDDVSELMEELGVDQVYQGTVGGSTVLGSVVAGNSSGVILSGDALDREVEEMEETAGVEVRRIPGKINAVGNVVLANDDAAYLSPELSPEAKEVVGEVLDVEVETGTVAGLGTVGSGGVASNRGVLVHPRTNDTEMDRLRETFDLKVEVGTINYGTPLVGSGLLANTEGYVAGTETTGAELGRIEEALGFIEN
ncbi:MAG: translation initiation factor IF-6 [Halobacteria archaeon]